MRTVRYCDNPNMSTVEQFPCPESVKCLESMVLPCFDLHMRPLRYPCPRERWPSELRSLGKTMDCAFCDSEHLCEWEEKDPEEIEGPKDLEGIRVSQSLAKRLPNPRSGIKTKGVHASLCLIGPFAASFTDGMRRDGTAASAP